MPMYCTDYDLFVIPLAAPVIPVNVSYTVSFTDVSIVWKKPTTSQNGSTIEYEVRND